MGCWYGTCMVTNLPIYEGDKIALFILKENASRKQHSYCYTHGEYALHTLPVFGEYNDYGGIQELDAQTDAEIKALVSQQLEMGELSLEDFINNEILRGNEKEFVAVMMHYGIYKQLIAEISNRVPYNNTKTYGQLIRNLMEKFKAVELGGLGGIPYGLPTEMRYAGIVRFAEEHRGLSRTLSAIHKTNSAILSDAYLNVYLLDRSLDSLRQRWYVPCGAGSQGQELDLHCKVAEFVLDHKKQRIDEYKSHSIMEPEEEKEFGKETIFYHGDED